MNRIEILVAPNGVGVPAELQDTAPNLPMLLSLAGAVGSLVRTTATVTEPVTIPVTVARSDEVGLVWVAGMWHFHASDLRAGTLSQFCAMVDRSRAKSLVAGQLATPNMTIPRFVMSLCAADEGIPVGIIVQSTHDTPPRPMVDFQLERTAEEMWLLSSYLGLVARIGEDQLQEVLRTAEALAVAPPADVARHQAALAAYRLPPDEEIACMGLDPWVRARGGDAIRAFRALVAP